MVELERTEVLRPAAEGARPLTLDACLALRWLSAELVDSPELLELVDHAKPPYLHFLDLKGVSENQFREVAIPLDRALTKLIAAGPEGYGGHPTVFPSMRASAEELQGLLRSDPRWAEP